MKSPKEIPEELWTVKVCGDRWGHRQSAESSYSVTRLTTSPSTTANNKEPTLAAPYQLPIGVAGRAGALCICGLFLLLQTDGEGEDDAAGDVELEGPALESAGELRLERVLDEFGSEVIDVVARGLDRKRYALDEGAVTGVDVEVEESVLASTEVIVNQVDTLGGDVVQGNLGTGSGVGERGERRAVLELTGNGERPMVVDIPSELHTCYERAVLVESPEHTVLAGILLIEEDIGVGGGLGERVEVVLQRSVSESRNARQPVTLPGDGEENVLGLQRIFRHIAQPEGVVDEDMFGEEVTVLHVHHLVVGLPGVVVVDTFIVVPVVVGRACELRGPLVVVESETGEQRELVVGVGSIPIESERHVEQRIRRLLQPLGGRMVSASGGLVHIQRNAVR